MKLVVNTVRSSRHASLKQTRSTWLEGQVLQNKQAQPALAKTNETATEALRVMIKPSSPQARTHGKAQLDSVVADVHLTSSYGSFGRSGSISTAVRCAPWRCAPTWLTSSVLMGEPPSTSFSGMAPLAQAPGSLKPSRSTQEARPSCFPN